MELIVDADWTCTCVLRLTGVCHLWRDIAQTSAVLWQKLSISSPSTSGWDMGRGHIMSVDVAAQYLKRSKKVPLSIAVRVPTDSTTGLEHPIYNILRAVVNAAFRWKSFTVVVYSDCGTFPNDGRSRSTCIHEIMSFLWQSGALLLAKILEELEIRCAIPFSSGIPCSTLAQPDVPILGEFRIRCLLLDPVVGRFPPEMLQHITSLSIGLSTQFEIWSDLLNHAPMLAHLTLTNMTSMPIVPAQFIQHMTNLKTIRFCDTRNASTAFSWFRTPSVHTIEVLSQHSMTHTVALSCADVVRLVGSAHALSQIIHLDLR